LLVRFGEGFFEVGKDGVDDLRGEGRWKGHAETGEVLGRGVTGDGVLWNGEEVRKGREKEEKRS
jgi:hypothetical protein